VRHCSSERIAGIKHTHALQTTQIMVLFPMQHAMYAAVQALHQDAMQL
jgi:hypothetical protein